MNTYTEEDSLVLAKLVATKDWHLLPVYCAEEIALRLRGHNTRAYLPSFVEDFVSLCHFNEVPRFMKYPELRLLIEWRLRIGK